MRTLPPTDKVGPDPSRPFGDFRVYQLPEPTSLASNQIKQVELIKAAGVKVTRTYLYDGSKTSWTRSGHQAEQGFGLTSNKKVNVLIEVQNRADHNLGVSLPKGKVRAYKKDADGSLEWRSPDDH